MTVEAVPLANSLFENESGSSSASYRMHQHSTPARTSQPASQNGPCFCLRRPWSPFWRIVYFIRTRTTLRASSFCMESIEGKKKRSISIATPLRCILSSQGNHEHRSLCPESRCVGGPGRMPQGSPFRGSFTPGAGGEVNEQEGRLKTAFAREDAVGRV